MWDSNSDKLVQENHPNLVQILGDRDLNGKPDGGFEKMFGFMDVIEVHPPEGIFTKPERDAKGQAADSLALTSATTASDFLQVQAGDDATTATFSEPGVYEVMLGGYDGDVAADFVIVTVEP